MCVHKNYENTGGKGLGVLGQFGSLKPRFALQ